MRRRPRRKPRIPEAASARVPIFADPQTARLALLKWLAERTASIERSNALHEALWQQAMAVAVKDNGFAPIGLCIQTLDEIIDSQGVRLAALRNRLSNIVPLVARPHGKLPGNTLQQNSATLRRLVDA